MERDDGGHRNGGESGAREEMERLKNGRLLRMARCGTPHSSMRCFSSSAESETETSDKSLFWSCTPRQVSNLSAVM